MNDEYDITFTPSSNLSIAVTPNTTNATGFIMSNGTSLTASMANDGGYYIKQVRLLNYSIPTATGTATALNSSSVTVTASDNIQFNYIEVTITSDYYGTITPKNGLTIGTAPTLTENGTNYYKNGTTITMNAPASHIIEATSGVNSQSNPCIAADKRSYTFMMLKQNVSPGATTKEVHTISCPSGLTVTSNPYFTYNSTKYYKKDETYTLTADDGKVITAFTATGAATSSVASDKRTATVKIGSSDVTVTATLQTISGTTEDGLSWSLAQDGNHNYTWLTISGTGPMKDYDHNGDSWYTDAPWGNGVTSVTIGNDVTSIGRYAFIGCQSLATATIGSSVTDIGQKAFDHCDALTTVTLPASVTSLHQGAFYNCVKLERIDIEHDGAVSLAGQVFQNDAALQYIVFPSPEAEQANTTGNWTAFAEKRRAKFGNQLFAVTTEGGSAAYKIATDDDLRNLATAVNAGNDGSGKTFRQTAIIDYDNTQENNYTPIGNSSHYFCGNYDGQGLTISGIRINKEGNGNSDKYQGIFGRTDGATIQGITLADADITGHERTGGIVGYNKGTVSNCHVAADVFIHAVISDADSHGGIVGSNYNGTVSDCTSAATLTSSGGNKFYGGIAGYNIGTLSHNLAIGAVVPAASDNYHGAISGVNNLTLQNNYYHACRVASNDITANNVGNKSADVTANNGAVPAFLVTLADGVTIQTEMADDLGFTYGGNDYWRTGAALTLGYTLGEAPEGYTASYVTTAGTLNGTTLTVGSADATVSATVRSDGQSHTVSYIKADGTTGTHNAIALDGTETDLSEGWYFVGTNINFTQTVTLSGDVHIILKDNAVMNIGTAQSPVSGDGIYGDGHSISIYAQSTGESKGQLYVSSSSNGIFTRGGNITICGGVVEVTANNNGGEGILAYKSGSTGGCITLTNATVTASGEIGIHADGGGLTINSGTVTANGNLGINAIGCNLLIKGGKVTATGTSSNGINANDGNVVISGGEVTATGTSSHGIKAYGGNVEISGGEVEATGTSSYGIYTEGGNVEISGGEVTATGTGTSSHGIYTKGGNVEITDCEVTATGGGDYYGIFATKSGSNGGCITLTNATVTASGAYGIFAYGDLFINGGKVTATGTSYNGIYANGGKVVISGSEVEATGTADHGIKADGGNVEISGGEVTATGRVNCFGIYATKSDSNGGCITLTNATVTASGAIGIFAYGDLLINGGKVTATGTSYNGIYAHGGNVEISGGEVEATGGEGYDGISANNITLGWTNADDYIYASRYYGTVNITPGKIFIDQDGTIHNATNVGTIDGKTLRPYNVPNVTPLNYLDISGTAQTINDYTYLDGTETDLAAGWYVADGTINFDHQLNASGDVHIILKDNAVMNVGTAQSPVSGHGIYAGSHSVSIYAQSTGESKGQLYVSSSACGIFTDGGNITISGGVVEAMADSNNGGEGIIATKSGSTGGCITLANATVTASGAYGIDARGGFTINSGTVTANGNRGISANGCDLLINGGKVTATSTSEFGIFAQGGNVEISGGEVEANGFLGIFASNCDLFIKGGKVTVTGTSDYAIYVSKGNVEISGGEVEATGAGGIYATYSITLANATVTASGVDGINAQGGLTINSGSVTVNSSDYGIIVNGSDLFIKGGKVTATSTSGNGIRAYVNVVISGGEVEATGSSGNYGIYASNGGAITLGWTNASDYIYASSYQGTVNITPGKDFIDEDDMLHTSDNVGTIDGKTLMGVDVLEDAATNDVAALATRLDGKQTNVVLNGRTLWKDGDWNTLCLPFSMTAEQVTAQLAPAGLMTLSTSSFADGTLSLNFEDSTTIEAGQPYIIKWSKPDGYTADGGFDITNPVFQGVTVPSDYSSDEAITEALATASRQTTYVDFIGIFSPEVIYESGDKTKLYLGAENALYYPLAEGFQLKACRGYFHLKNGLTAGEPSSSVRAFNLNFGDEATGVTTPLSPARGAGGEAWYSIDGVRLDAQPTRKGLYIHGGRKVVIP